MSIAKKLATIAENEAKVYEAGIDYEHNRFWDEYQDYGKRYNYLYAFYRGYWTDKVYNPTYTIKVSSAAAISNAFANSAITDTKVDIDISGCKYNSSDSNTIVSSIFMSCSALKTIRKLIISENVAFSSNLFYRCSSLVDLMVEGSIGNNGFNISYSTLISAESLLSILQSCNLDFRETDQTVSITLPAQCIDKTIVTQDLLEGKLPGICEENLYYALCTAYTTALDRGYTVTFITKT